MCAHNDYRRIAPPLLPEPFKEALEQKQFMNAKDDVALLVELHHHGMRTYFGQTFKLNFSGLEWGDAEMDQLAGFFRSGMLGRLELLHLEYNEIGDEGMTTLASVIASGVLLRAGRSCSMVTQETPLRCRKPSQRICNPP